MCRNNVTNNPPPQIGYIDTETFKGCSALRSVSFPEGLVFIGNSAFDGCTGLEKITIPNSVTSIDGYAFQNCSNLVSIEMGNGIKKIGWASFKGCVGLKYISIPNSVTDIGVEAFYGCKGLKKIYLGSALKDINYRAFAECQDLECVYLYADDVPYAQSDVFKNSYTDYATLYVPLSSLDKYKSKYPWNSFKEILPLSDQEMGIGRIRNNDGKIISCYTLDGQLNKKQRKGLNIIKTSDGKTSKVIVK